MQSSLRSRLRLFAATVGILLGAFVLPLPAAAHTELIASDPPSGASLRQPPASVALTFNEPMDPRLAVVALTVDTREPARLDVAAGADATELVATVPPGMTHGGRWSVAFRVTSGDGHPVQGDVAFSVERPSDVGAEEPPATPSAVPPPAPESTSGDGGPGLAVIAAAAGGGALLLALLLLLARYLRVDES